jgi:hypothetical protein
LSGSCDRIVGVAASRQELVAPRAGNRDPAIRGAPVGRDGAAAVARVFQDLAESKCGPGVTQLVCFRKCRPGGLEIAAIQVQKPELV